MPEATPTIQVSEPVVADPIQGMVSAQPQVPAKQEGESKIISDEQLLGVYGDIMKNIEEDRNEVSEILNRFVDMVINEGDSSGSSKEAVVNLIKVKTDMADKKAKVADLMTRLKLKERDTFPKYLAQTQNNIQIGDNGSKRALLEALAKAQKKTEGAE